MPAEKGLEAPSAPGLELLKSRYPKLELGPEDAFYYVYGIFHSPEYRTRYHNNLFREIPRIPVADSEERVRTIIRIGRRLGDLHCGYEELEPWPLTLEWHTPPGEIDPVERYRCVKRMRWEGPMGERDWTVLHYNEHLTIRDIPARAWTYRIGKHPALKHVRNYQCVRSDRRTGLISDGNAYDSDPGYTLDLFGKVVRVAMTTLDLMREIPPLGKV